jgi:hypothetical protein
MKASIAVDTAGNVGPAEHGPLTEKPCACLQSARSRSVTGKGLMETLKKQMRDLLDLLWVNSPATPQISITDEHDYPVVWAVWLVGSQWINIQVDVEGWWIGGNPIKLTTHEGNIGELPTYESLQEYRDMIEQMGKQVVMRAPERLDILL